MLQKKKAKDGKSKYDTEDRDFPVPASVTVIRRDPTQDEEDIREDAREKFMEVSVFGKFELLLGLLVARGRNCVGVVPVSWDQHQFAAFVSELIEGSPIVCNSPPLISILVS